MIHQIANTLIALDFCYSIETKNLNKFVASAESGADFVLSKSDRVVSVLSVRDPECRLADQAKGVPLYAVGHYLRTMLCIIIGS